MNGRSSHVELKNYACKSGGSEGHSQTVITGVGRLGWHKDSPWESIGSGVEILGDFS